MKKLLLIDDEQLITLSIAKMIERSHEAYEVVGTAANGRDALEFLEHNPVDIAIVDIRMPILDGIGLLEEIQKRELPARIIILSAYRDFEYAQKALRYGASAYLLKPLSQDALMSTLGEVSQLVEQDREMKTAASLFSQKRRQQAVYQLLEKGEVDSEYLPDSLKVGAPGCLMLLSCPIEFPQPFIEDCHGLGWEPYRDFQQVCFLPQALAAKDNIRQIAEKTQALMEDYFLPSLTISRSEGGFFTSQLQDAFIQCKVASMYSFYFPDELVIDYSSIHLFGLTSIRPIVSAFEELHSFIKLCNSSLIFKQLEEIYKSLKVEMGVNPQTLYQLFYEMFVEFQILEKSLRTDDHCQRTFADITLHHLQNFTTLDALYDYSVSLIRRYFDGTAHPVAEDRDEQIVEKVKEFCRQNYAADCTLDDMAAKVYISKSYLSQIFKEKCGISIWNYFTDIRIKKAKKLLSSSEIKVNKVGEMVGYKNASHFGHIFRSHVGVSPKEFRQKIRTDDAP